MKFHTTKDKYNRVTYYASRKKAIAVINADHILFPNAIGLHYAVNDMTFNKEALVILLNAVNR
jgi:hypothetical protein